MAKKNTTTGYELSSNAIQSYLDAKTAQRNIRTNWDTASDLSGQVLGAVQDRQEAIRVDEENKRKELESHEEQFSNNVLKITENSGSLGEEYYGIATEQAKLLQQEYMDAVRAGDKEAQTKIKMRLQGLSTGVGSLKESLSIAAELKNDGVLSNGRTAEEIKIANICTNPANAVYQDGEWFFKDPDTGQMYTTEDLDKSLGQVDEVVSKAYLEYEMGQNEAGMNYVNGTGADFNFNRIKTSIGDNFIKEDNIMSIMHDDFRKSGESNTFAADLSSYLEQMPDYYKTFNIDVDGDGIPGNSEQDKAALVKAITDKTDVNYDFKMSKNIVADYLTRQSQEKFYGSHPSGLNSTQRKALRPEPGENPKVFIARGGIMGELAKEGTVWNEDLGMFVKKGSDMTTQEILDKA
tara:strand:+ start:376 stop:1596 length:1221 start_codon:yes stop_codon:yes gene_type:complete